MNVYAYHPEDRSKELIHIDDWVVKYGPNTDGRCRICNNIVYVKAAISQKQTHFAHYTGSNCPSIVSNHKPYEVLRDLPRNAAESFAAKQWLLDNAIYVYEKIRSEFRHLSLTWIEFLQLVELANKLDIWSLRDMPHGYIPYVLLVCRDVFVKSQYRKRESYFVLEPSPTGRTFWNDGTVYKSFIWEVYLPSRDVTYHPIKLSLDEPWYINKLTTLLE